MPEEPKRPLKVFLCHAHIIPLWDGVTIRVPQGDDMRGLYARLTKDGVDAWLDKEKLHGERSRTILPGQGFDTVSERRTVNLPDWELEIRKAVR